MLKENNAGFLPYQTGYLNTETRKEYLTSYYFDLYLLKYVNILSPRSLLHCVKPYAASQRFSKRSKYNDLTSSKARGHGHKK